MGMRAVTTVIDHTGQPNRFWAAWASPEYQIPHLANFVTWADQTGAPLTITSHQRYATDHPGTLPADNVTDAFADEDERGDLDYRYHLTLNDETRAVRLVVRNMRVNPDRRVIHTVDRADLYATAAQMCDLLAQRGHAYADANNGVGLPGGDPDTWRAAAAEFRQLQQVHPRRGAQRQPRRPVHPGQP